MSRDVGEFLHTLAELADGNPDEQFPTLHFDEFEVPSMMDRRDIDQIAVRLVSLVPPGLADAHTDLRANFRDVLAQGLRRLELVTREEFDVQSQLLARTRAKVDELEKRVAQLESGAASGP
jgi:BMFP domain-containing protein YqiC